MESPQHIKSRLKSVKNIGQITKAMEVVSATKMRKAQEVALRSRPYAFKALELLETVGNVQVEIPLAEHREIKKTLLVVVTSDKGLAGAFNTQVFRQVEQFLAQEGNASEIHVVPVGKRAVSFFSRRNAKIVESFTGFGDYAMPEELESLGTLLVDGFLNGSWDRVVTISTHFRSTLKQTPLVRELLPIDVTKIHETVREIVPEHGRFSGQNNELGIMNNDQNTEFILEPSPEETLGALIPHLVTMQLYHVVLEANASEHSARMVAMKTASDNASDLADGLTLEFNKARQAGITKEIIEITSTMNALQ
ncbi:MAG: ATP synthase F1 subunit gamma [Patescibacteria group bacterium]